MVDKLSIKPDSGLYQIFCDAVQLAYNADNFRPQIGMGWGYEQYAYLNDVFETEVSPRLLEEEAEHIHAYFSEFLKAMKNNWSKFDDLYHQGGSSYTLIPKIADRIADETVMRIENQTSYHLGGLGL